MTKRTKCCNVGTYNALQQRKHLLLSLQEQREVVETRKVVACKNCGRANPEMTEEIS